MSAAENGSPVVNHNLAAVNHNLGLSTLSTINQY